MATMTTTTLTAAVGARDLLIPLAAVTDVVAQGPPLFTETTLFCQREAMTVLTFSGLVVRVARGAMGTQATGHPSGVTVYVGPTTAYGLSQPSGTFSMPQGGYTPLVVVSDGTIWNDVNGSWGQTGGDTGIVDSVFSRTGAVVAVAGDYGFDKIGAGTSAVALVVGTGGSLATSGSGSIAASTVPAAGIAAGTNAHALVIGTGGSLGTSGSGTITATAVPVAGITGTGTGWLTQLATAQSANWVGVPATAGAAGVAGQAAYESGFLYVCVATNTWQRVAIATWP